jgi:hypothetical protein
VSGGHRFIDPQNVDAGAYYANVSALLYTFAELKAVGAAVPGLRKLVRRSQTVHGGMTLFQLARHPIDRASRAAIARRLRSGDFERLVAEWKPELESCEAQWGDGRVNVEDLVRFSDE